MKQNYNLNDEEESYSNMNSSSIVVNSQAHRLWSECDYVRNGVDFRNEILTRLNTVSMNLVQVHAYIKFFVEKDVLIHELLDELNLGDDVDSRRFAFDKMFSLIVQFGFEPEQFSSKQHKKKNTWKMVWFSCYMPDGVVHDDIPDLDDVYGKPALDMIMWEAFCGFVPPVVDDNTSGSYEQESMCDYSHISIPQENSDLLTALNVVLDVESLQDVPVGPFSEAVCLYDAYETGDELYKKAIELYPVKFPGVFDPEHLATVKYKLAVLHVMARDGEAGVVQSHAYRCVELFGRLWVHVNGDEYYFDTLAPRFLAALSANTGVFKACVKHPVVIPIKYCGGARCSPNSNFDRGPDDNYIRNVLDGAHTLQPVHAIGIKHVSRLRKLKNIFSVPPAHMLKKDYLGLKCRGILKPLTESEYDITLVGSVDDIVPYSGRYRLCAAWTPESILKFYLCAQKIDYICSSSRNGNVITVTLDINQLRFSGTSTYLTGAMERASLSWWHFMQDSGVFKGCRCGSTE